MAADAEPCRPGVAAPDPLGEPVPKHPRQRTTLAGVAATAATVLLAAGAAGAASATTAGAGAARAAGASLRSASATAARPAAARSLVLINGDRLLVRTTPRGGRVIALSAAPGAGPLSSLNLGQRSEAIPADAQPYLGQGLDASLFDLSSLQRAETGGNLPVQVTFAGRRPALPGVRITRWGRGTASGYLTASSARIFGAALARQARADYARASYGTDGLFAGGVDIALAGTAAQTRARPRFAMHTVTVTATNLQGKPATGGSLIVVNAGDWRKFGDPNEVFSTFYHGTAKYSVPAGTYWAIADFTNSSFTSQRLVVLPQFTVTGKATTVHLSERAATSRLAMVTSRPAELQTDALAIIRGGLHGTSASYEALGFGGPLWVSPTTRKPTVGTLRTYTSGQLTSPPKAPGVPYAYNLAFQGPDGTIPAQNFVVAPASLATVNERYYQDVTATGAWTTYGGFVQATAATGITLALLTPVQLPGLQTQYMSAGPAIVWSSSYFEFLNDFFGSGQFDTFRTYQPGQQLTEEWNRYPLHPQQNVQLLHGSAARLNPQYPSAFRQDNILWLAPNLFSDNQLGHAGAGLVPSPGVTLTGSYAIYQNGVRIGHGNPANGISPVNLSTKPATIRFVLGAGRLGKPFPQSPASRTVWTWKSVPDPSATVPASWFCGYVIVGNQFGVNRHCSVQSLLTLNYRVQGLALNGTTPSGPQVIGLSVGHIQLGHAAPITGATAQVSYNDGQTWQLATVSSSGGGNFRISFTAPAGVDPTLRVGATDSAGGSITETISRAYGVAS
jgi:hypothetical protein